MLVENLAGHIAPTPWPRFFLSGYALNGLSAPVAVTIFTARLEHKKRQYEFAFQV